jgi:uncharacterized membrane protein
MTESWTWGRPEFWPLAALVLAAGAWLTLRRGLRGGGWRLRAAACCKLALWALLALLVCDPRRVRETPRQGANEVTLAVPASLRWTRPSNADGATLADAVRKALQPGTSWRAQVEEVFQTRLIEAGGRLRAVKGPDDLVFDSVSGDVVKTVRSLRAGGVNSRLAAVVLFTDGHASDAALADEVARETGAAVFPVLVEPETALPELAITSVGLAQTPFEDAPVTLTVQVRALGWEERPWTLAAVDGDGRVLARERRAPRLADETAAVRLQLGITRPGLSFVRLRLAAGEPGDEELAAPWGEGLPGDAWALNNERLIGVDRGSGPYRVLYVAGRPNWEYKFLRRALAADTEVQMPALVRIAKREPKFEWRGRAGETGNPLFRGFGNQAEEQVLRYDQPVLVRLETSDAAELRDGFPKTAEELMARYRAIIIDDLEAEFFNQEQMRLIERFVSQRGGSLLLLGGQECFREGGYEHTPVGRMCPVQLDGSSPVVAAGGVRLDLSREGWLEPALRLRTARDEEERRLQLMPAFHTVNPAGSVKPGAFVLATVSAEADEPARPALVTQRYGAGRVTALLVADLWRWGMLDEEHRGDMEKFWRQLLRWSLVDVPDQVELAVEPASAGGDSRARRVSVRVRDRAFRPADDATVRIHVTGPDGAETLLYGEPSLSEAGLFEAEHVSALSGAYRVRVEVNSQDAAAAGEADWTRVGVDEEETAAEAPALPSPEGGWSHDPAPELAAELTPATTWLDRLAEGTGGRRLTLGEIGKLPELLKGLDAPVMERLVEPLWHHPAVFALLLGLMIGEWTLRRRAGLA